MHKFIIPALLSFIIMCLASCSSKITTTIPHGSDYVKSEFVAYDKLTMNLAPEPIEYTISIKDRDGRMKLQNLNLEEAKNLALVEAIMKNKCVTIFEPKFTHHIVNGNILRVTVYGNPAYYKTNN